MKEQEFRNWLLGLDKMQPNSAETRISNCRTVENSFGNLDDHYIKDRGQKLLATFTYSTNDRDNEIPPKHNLNLTGDVHGTTANLKHSIKRYMEFKASETEADTDEITQAIKNTAVKPDMPMCSVDTIFNLQDDVLNKNSSLVSNSSSETPLKFINELKGFTFSIDKYQRGYRWGMREIHSLLNDIFEFDTSKESFYCLQPLVLKTKEKNTYELIDGQQRATTIYLILKYLLQQDFFHLKYETRGDDNGYNIFLNDLATYEIPDFIETEKKELDKSISEYWKMTFVPNHTIEDNVDNFYLFKAYCIIKNWFNGNTDTKQTLQLNLLYKTKVIWYEDSVSIENATNTFINFNDGKISLDQAELVKGLFVLDFGTIPDTTRKAYEENQFADEWNIIEQHLKVPSFWNFINNEKDNRDLANKINLLLQIEKGKSKKAEDVFYTYREYEKGFKSLEKPNWRNLSSLYNQLEEWFNERETYHLMGAVVHLTNTSIYDVIKYYTDKSNKDELKTYLKCVLTKEFFKDDGTYKEKYNPDEIKYGKSGVFPILLLYNIAISQQTDKYYKFPFDLFKQIKSWNIEHIYAKNSKGFEKLSDLQDWHQELSNIIEDKSELQTNENFQKLWKKVDLSDLTKSNAAVKEIELSLSEIMDKDNLSNLCLLDSVTNIQIGNRVFRDKREIILEIEKELNEGAYVPMATKMVFQKAITTSENVRMNYWNSLDREAYIEDIKKRVKQFVTVKS